MTFDLHNLDHARDFHRSAGVDGLNLAAVHRRARNGGVEHAVEMHVCTVNGAAIDDIGTVDSLGAFLADIAEFRRLLEPQAVTRRYRQRTGCSGQSAVTQFTAGRFMDDFMQLCMAFADRHFPLICSGLFKHGPRGSTAATHRLVPVAHAARAIGVLVTEAHFVARRLLHLHHRPVGFQLIGHHHRQAGAHTLAHFRTVADHGHRAVSGDADVNLRIVDPAVGHAIGAEFLLFLRSESVLPAPTRHQNQRTGGANAFEETAATEVAQREIIR